MINKKKIDLKLEVIKLIRIHWVSFISISTNYELQFGRQHCP